MHSVSLCVDLKAGKVAAHMWESRVGLQERVSSRLRDLEFVFVPLELCFCGLK